VRGLKLLAGKRGMLNHTGNRGGRLVKVQR